MKLTFLALAGLIATGAANAQTPVITGLQYGAPITAEQAQVAGVTDMMSTTNVRGPSP